MKVTGSTRPQRCFNFPPHFSFELQCCLRWKSVFGKEQQLFSYPLYFSKSKVINIYAQAPVPVKLTVKKMVRGVFVFYNKYLMKLILCILSWGFQLFDSKIGDCSTRYQVFQNIISVGQYIQYIMCVLRWAPIGWWPVWCPVAIWCTACSSGYQVLVVFFAVVLCHFVVCHWASSPCRVHCSCYLLSCILSSGNLSLLCSVLLLFIK